MHVWKKLAAMGLGLFWVCAACSWATVDHPHSYPDLGVDMSNLKKTVTFLTDIHPYRNDSNPGSLNKAASYIEILLNTYGLKTEIQSYDVKGITYKNVIGSIGTDKIDRVVVGAHYDVCGDQPGADDNASAVAGLLEVARLVAMHGASLPYGIDFVAYSLEEPPNFGSDQMGSFIHAKSLHDQGVSVKGMICLEMIGYFTTRDNSQEYPLGIMTLAYPKVGNFIAVVGNMKSSHLKRMVAKHMKHATIDVETLSAPEFIKGVGFSDHRNYWQFNDEAVMVTDTAFFRNPNYHRTTDTPNTLNYEKMAEVVKGVTWAVLNL